MTPAFWRGFRIGYLLAARAGIRLIAFPAVLVLVAFQWVDDKLTKRNKQQ